MGSMTLFIVLHIIKMRKFEEYFSMVRLRDCWASLVIFSPSRMTTTMYQDAYPVPLKLLPDFEICWVCAMSLRISDTTTLSNMPASLHDFNDICIRRTKLCVVWGRKHCDWYLFPRIRDKYPFIIFDLAEWVVLCYIKGRRLIFKQFSKKGSNQGSLAASARSMYQKVWHVTRCGL